MTDASVLLPNPYWSDWQVAIMAVLWVAVAVAFFWLLFSSSEVDDPDPVSEQAIRAELDARETAMDPIHPAAPRFMREHQNTVISLAARRGER